MWDFKSFSKRLRIEDFQSFDKGFGFLDFLDLIEDFFQPLRVRKTDGQGNLFCSGPALPFIVLLSL